MVSGTIAAQLLSNLIGGERRPARQGGTFAKHSPASGRPLSSVPRSSADDVDDAVGAAVAAQPGWAATPAVQRGLILHQIVRVMQDRAAEFADVVAAETGKSPKDAAGETVRSYSAGTVFRRRGSADVRPNHDERCRRPSGHDHPSADRRGRPHRAGQYAHRQRRLESLSRACVRKHGGAQVRGRHAGDRRALR